MSFQPGSHAILKMNAFRVHSGRMIYTVIHVLKLNELQ